MIGALVGAIAPLAIARAVSAQDANPAAPPPVQEEDSADPKTPARVGNEVVVVLLGGQRIRGVLVEDAPEYVAVRVSNVATRIARDRIERVIPQRPALERYHEMRAIIDDNDVDRLLLLVEWLRTHDLLDEAHTELEHVLSIEPKNGDALRAARLVSQQIELRDKARREADAPAAPAPTPPEPGPRRPTPGEFPLLTPEQINLIEVYEIDLANAPRILIERPTIEEMLNKYSDQPEIPSTRDGRAAFLRKPAVEVLETMFALRARELYPSVRVLSLPESLRRFRDHVNTTWLVNACATTRCHGGDEAGRLLLYNRSPGGEASAVTNFLILDRFKMQDGTPLIDYGSPDRSPLLQLGLPRPDSIRPHPDVAGWSPTFRTREDHRFKQAVEWIQAMHRPRPDYPVEYTPPSVVRAAKPADAAAPDR